MTSCGAEDPCKCVYCFNKLSNSQSYIAKVACYGVHHRSTAAKQHTSSRETLPVCEQLESDHRGSMGSQDNTGFFNPIPGRSETGSCSPSLPISSRPISAGTGRVVWTDGQRSHHPIGTIYGGRGLLLHPLLSSKEGGPMETGYKPQSSQFVGAAPTLQDGGDSHPTRVASSERLASQTRPQGRVFYGSNPPGPSQIPALRCTTSSPAFRLVYLVLLGHSPRFCALLQPSSVHWESGWSSISTIC